MRARAVDAAGKVEVIEFFWYGCPHCYHFEPTFRQWLKTQPKDVVQRLVAVPLNPMSWTPGSKLYYALDAMGIEEKLRNDLFAAIHTERSLSPNDERAFPAWVAKKGVDAAKFMATMESFGVKTKSNQARGLADAYKIDGVPALGIAGQYFTNVGLNGSEKNALATVDFLVNKVRSGK